MAMTTEQAELQCTVVKRELYKLKEKIDAITHDENRAQALGLFDKAYGACDTLQTFLKGR